MYDASLDQFKQHNWTFNPIQNPIYYSYSYRNSGQSFGNITFDNVGNASAQPCFFGQGFGDSFQAINQYSGYNDTARTYTGFLLISINFGITFIASNHKIKLI